MDANFFSSWPFIIGRTASGIPQVNAQYFNVIILAKADNLSLANDRQ